MKTAVLISGEMCSFAKCLPSLQWTVFRKLKDPHFFISCAKDEQSSTAYLLEQHYKGKVFIEVVEQPTLTEPNKRFAEHAPYAISAPIQSILRQLWFYQRVWGHFHECQATAERKDSFTTFVRCRPDLFFHRFEAPSQPLPHEFLGVWKARCGGVNDRFSIMGPRAAEAYFTAFLKVQKLLDAGCPLHPESIQQAAMESEGVGIRNTLACEFTGIRLNGENVPLLEYPGEMAQFVEALSHEPASIKSYTVSTNTNWQPGQD